MKIKKFRIINYKSIIDSNICYFNKKITILAGKNEAGKTAILEALEDLNFNKIIRENAIPISNRELKPLIRLWITLEKKDLEILEKEFKLKALQEEIEILYKKQYPNVSIISEKYFNSFRIEDVDYLFEKKNFQSLIKDWNLTIHKSPIGEEHFETLEVLDDFINKFKINPNLSVEQKQKLGQLISNFKNKLKGIKDFWKNVSDFIKINFIPNFILFKTFEDIYPTEIAIAEAPKNELITDLASISGLDFKLIQPDSDPRLRRIHEEKVNINFSEEYELFWTQDHSKLVIDWDSKNLYFWIKEGDELYPPNIRSKGKQWHLAFYTRITARSIETKNNIILIDEPGLFLHAKAQKDILKKLDACCDSGQLVYATHSPYLIPASSLDRVRLVIKNESDGTLIKKVTAKADKETLTPILTAIGEDLSVGIRTDKKNSIVVEGFSDFLWLKSWIKLLDIKSELNFVPAVGASNTVNIGAILFGWGLDPLFLLDNDEAGNIAKKKLMKKLSIKEENIYLIPESKEGEIEDLFSSNDFKKYADWKKSSNSKIILATLFLDKVEGQDIKKDDLEQASIDSFKLVFEKLKKMIE